VPTDSEQNFEKLYRNPSTKWLRLPVVARGIGDELLRVCDPSTGFICETCEPGDVSLILRAHEKEQSFVKRALELLLEAKFIVSVEGKLYLRKKFERNEERKARHAAHMRDKRNREPGEPREPGELSPGKTDRQTKGSISDPTDPRRVELDTKVRRVFDAWKQDTGHDRAKLDQKRRSRIAARLKDFTPEQLITVIEHRHHDPFLMGKNDLGKVYDGVETLFRDTAQVERLLDLTEPMRPHKAGTEPKQPTTGYTSPTTTFA